MQRSRVQVSSAPPTNQSAIGNQKSQMSRVSSQTGSRHLPLKQGECEFESHLAHQNHLATEAQRHGEEIDILFNSYLIALCVSTPLWQHLIINFKRREKPKCLTRS